MPKTRLILICLIVLIILASATAYYFYHKSKAIPGTTEVFKTSQTSTPQIIRAVYPVGATSPEKVALTVLPANATDGAKLNRFSAVKLAAKPGTTLTLKNCFATPLVLQASAGQKVSLVNKDPVAHQIRVNAEHIYPVAASSSAEIKVDFGTAAYYSYYCDKRQYPAGVFLIQK